MKLNVNKNMNNERSGNPTPPPVPPQPPPTRCYYLPELKRKGIIRVQRQPHSSSKLKRKSVGKTRSSSKLKRKNVCNLQKDAVKCKRDMVLIHRNDLSFYHFFESSEPPHAPRFQSFSILLKKVALQDIFTCSVLSSYALSSIRVHFMSFYLPVIIHYHFNFRTTKPKWLFFESF